MTKLDAVKAEMGENDSMLLNGPEKVQNKYNQTLFEVEKLEDSERNTEHLAKRLSRDLKIRSGVERSPSARKIGSLRRRRDSATRLSRNQSWHLGQSSPVASTSFYPKSNLKRAKPVPVVSRPLPSLPAVSSVVPEKPLRVKRESTDNFVTPMKTMTKPQESWTPATVFFKDVPAEEPEKHEDMFFKTPVRPTRNEVKTPMLPPRITPAKRFTPGTPMNFNSMLATPTMNDSSQGRESIIILRNKNAGMVAQKAKLFNGMNQELQTGPIKIPRVIINKNIENVKSMETPKKVPSPSPRRSSRSSPGLSNRCQFKTTNYSPLKTIKECSESQKAKLLKPETLSEIASPKRKPLSQNNTPRRASRTPKRKQTPSKSPRFVRRNDIAQN